MLATHSQLEYLLSPVATETFFRDTWERRPLAVHRRTPDYYDGLLSRSDLEHVIAFTRPAFVEPDGSRASTYLRGLPPDSPSLASGRPLGVAQVRQAFDQGKSIVLMGMQERRREAAELCLGLQAAFGCPVHANAYLTPRGSQGFAPHFDTHEAFILQLAGSKHWRLYGAAAELPLVSDGGALTKRPVGDVEEVRLQAGDLLYIPRGHVHEAFAAEEDSLHLTVGVNVYRWVELLHCALDAAAERDVRLRESIPAGALLADRSAAESRFEDLFASLVAPSAAGDRFEQAWSFFSERFFARLQDWRCGRFGSAGDLDQLAIDSVVQKRPDAICRVVELDGQSAIEFPGNRVAGPQRIDAALRFIAAAGRFAVRDLPDDLNDDGKLVLVRRLCREGLLEVVGRGDREQEYFPGALSTECDYANCDSSNELAETMGNGRRQSLVR